MTFQTAQYLRRLRIGERKAETRARLTDQKGSITCYTSSTWNRTSIHHLRVVLLDLQIFPIRRDPRASLHQSVKATGRHSRMLTSVPSLREQRSPAVFDFSICELSPIFYYRDEMKHARGTGAVAIYPLLLHRLRPNAQITGTG